MQDMVAAVFDGGGENEGWSGVHSLLKESGDTYADRKCFPHVAWRTVDQGLDEVSREKPAPSRISSFLHGGLNWYRKRYIQKRGGDFLFVVGTYIAAVLISYNRQY